ncbi:MAG TPA: hypothetical protein VL126_01945 [Bacteroidota bacterium]|nr:hypothetical protein [Bacteroidota bacterium]
MRWIVLTTVLVVAVFITVYVKTADIWMATILSAIPAFAFLIGVGIQFVRMAQRRWQKVGIAVVASVMIVGFAAHWVVMWKMTDWQVARLLLIRRVIYNGEVMATLRVPALETYRGFREAVPGTTIGQVFRRLYPTGRPPIDSLVEAETGPFFTSISDTSVLLIEQAGFVGGFDTAFVNHDGRHGLAQIQMRLTKEGAFYDIQN